MMADTATVRGDRLGAYALFGGILSAAGLPIYLYAPKYYADTFGVSLAAMGTLLFLLRLVDFAQDPFLGWLSERLSGPARRLAVAGGAALLALCMVGLFAVTPPIAPIWWFALTITGLFTAFSFLTINFYAQGVAKAGEITGGHTRLAAWRESGSLLGVCIAAVLPTALAPVTGQPFAVFAGLFTAVVVIATVVMAPEWRARADAPPPTPIRTILADTTAVRLLALALVNATPLAVSSTLFLFFVESRLGAPGWEGPLLVLFFLSAAFSAPVWSRLAQRYGARSTLLAAMVLSIVAFLFVLTLGEGDILPFALICVVTGATIGADLTLLPALFARRMADIAPNAGTGFGLWSLVQKLTLAFAAVLLLPILEASGFVSGATGNSSDALRTLTYLYALVPCLLKLIAIALLLATPMKETNA
jgi:GPH family glycoside/pentoside/hexuronide:cation symporter